MPHNPLISSLHRQRRLYLAAAESIEKTIVEISNASFFELDSSTTQPGVTAETITGSTAPGQLFQTPHGDPA
jgi:hypothetical protein